MAIEYGNVNPSRRLAGGERFLLVLERHVPFFGMSRIDTLAEAWDNVGKSRYFYVVSPSREQVTNVDQKVGGLVAKARLEAAQVQISVDAAMSELQTHLGFMRIRRADSVDAKAATSAERQAETVQEERDKGAGKGTLDRALEKAGDTAGAVFAEAYSLVKVVLILGGIVAIAYAYNAVKKA